MAAASNRTAPLSSSGGGSTHDPNVSSAAADNALLSSILASPNFSVASYLNVALQQALEESQQAAAASGSNSSNTPLFNDAHTTMQTQNNNNDALSQRMAELALQLQLQTQACHEDIGRIGAELQAILPRCHADVGRVSVGLQGLRLDATSLLETTIATTTASASTSTKTSNSNTSDAATAAAANESSSTSLDAKNTATAATGEAKSNTTEKQASSSLQQQHHQPSSLETLSTLHALQANLTRTKEILTAAATWDSTLADLAPLLASPGNLPAAVGKLAVLEKGEKALRGMPHPEQRTAALNKFKTQVATLLQPQLVHALQSMTSSSSRSSISGGGSGSHISHIGPLQQCVSLYSQLNMLDDLKKEYVHVRPAALHKSWWEYRPSLPPPTTPGGSSLSQQQQQPALVTWLPTWFESVLQLLGEERRQAQAVFGPSHAVVPFVMCQVLESTFSPILSSFASRLENLHSITPSSTSAANNNNNNKTAESLAWTAAIYESTIQFMSLAYEAVAAAYLDLMESSGGCTTSTASSSTSIMPPPPPNDHRDYGLALYQDLQKLFIKIASPFSPYQKRLAELERETTKHTLQTLSQQIQQWTLPLQQQQQQQKRGGGGGGGALGQPPNKAPPGAAAAAGTATPKASLESLVMATDGLLQLLSSTRGMLPHAELSVGRMELLQGGYMSTETLQAIDEALAGHVEELIRAVETLRAASLSDNNTTTASTGGTAAADESFDEPHVLCALEVLKIAGTCRRQMQRIQDLTRQRLSVLSQRIMDHEVREKELEQMAAAELNKASRGTAGGGGVMSSSISNSGKRNPFLLPDALSIVEISSIITRAVLCTNKGDTATALAVLHRLAAAPPSISSDDGDAAGLVRLYPQADESAKRLAHSCHTFVFDVCYAVPRRHLAGMSSMAAWKEASPTGQDNFASYGTLPQSYITHVGEHMLALVQALEPFASDREALALANEVMDGVREVAVQPWLDLTSACGVSSSSSLRGSSSEQQFIRKLMSGKDLADLVMGNVVMEEEGEDEEEEDAGQDGGEGAKASAAFCNAWLDVVGLAVTGRLLERIMRIPSLTPKGCEHLNADLNYLVNVFAALGVAGHPHPLLGHLSEIVLLDGPTLMQRISVNSTATTMSAVGGGGDLAVKAAFLRSMEERLAAMRGQN